MNRKIVGKVTDAEKYQLLIIYEKIIALKEVEQTLDNKGMEDAIKAALKQKIEEILPKTMNDYKQWWISKVNKYKWKQYEDMQYNVDFSNNNVFVIYMQHTCNA